MDLDLDLGVAAPEVVRLGGAGDCRQAGATSLIFGADVPIAGWCS